MISTKQKTGNTERQKAFFRSGKTQSYHFRKEMLSTLEKSILQHEDELLSALAKDLGKSRMEAYITEIAPVLNEIQIARKQLKKWMKVKKVKTPLVIQPGRSYIKQEAYGLVLIIGPWNYPVHLTLSPLIAAIAAGNCITLKPSEISSHSVTAMEKLIKENFDQDYIDLVQGGVSETQDLLSQDYDYIFFTGSTKVGKIVMKKASEQLIPLTLELGGKNPTIIHSDAKLQLAAKRVAWSKFINAGQTCIAPDYILVHESVRDAFLVEIKKVLKDFYGGIPELSPDFSRIIDSRNHQRLSNLMENQDYLLGGAKSEEKLYIEPTIIGPINWDNVLMDEEIFGPILPLISYTDLEDHFPEIYKRGKPLTLYIFSESKDFCNRIAESIPSGAVNFNDTFAHILNPHLPFGGVGSSGMGNYHGEAGFKTFSHARSYVDRSTGWESSLKYPPISMPLNRLKKALPFLLR